MGKVHTCSGNSIGISNKEMRVKWEIAVQIEISKTKIEIFLYSHLPIKIIPIEIVTNFVAERRALK